MYTKLAEIKMINGKQTIYNFKEIELRDVEQLFNYLKPIAEYKHIKYLYKISISNGNELQSFLNSFYSNDISIQKMKSDQIFIEGNRLIANYCSFIGMFIDQIEKVLSKKGNDSLEGFRKTTNDLYNDKFEYRFFVLLRNFVIHYSLPFTLYNEDFNSKSLKLSKSHLLGFSKWKHVKNDLEKMDEEIEIFSYINPMNVNLTVLFLTFVYYLSKEIIGTCERVSEFIIKHKVKSPAIVKYESIEEFKKGNMVLTPIDLKDLKNAFNDVKSHPNINITVNDITPDWLKE